MDDESAEGPAASLKSSVRSLLDTALLLQIVFFRPAISSFVLCLSCFLKTFKDTQQTILKMPVFG